MGRTLILCALGLVACACNSGPRPLQWELEYQDPDVETEVVGYRFAIVVGGCPDGTVVETDPDGGVDGGLDAGRLDAGPPLRLDGGMDAGLPTGDAGFPTTPGSVRYEVELRRGEAAEMSPPVLDPGRWGFLVEARADNCTTIAVGCSELDLPLEGQTVSILLGEQSGPAPCQPGRCIDGICGMPDASVAVPDGCVPRDESCNRVDDDCDGYVDEDFDLRRDTMHCGSCGNACPPVQNGEVTCESGGCRTDCEESFSFCPGDRGTCDTDISQPENCGGCDNFCPTERPICGTARTCVDTCAPGETLCGRTCVDPFSDPNHCGGCNIDCSRDNANTVCTTGACEIATCHADYADCDGDLANGCEEYTLDNEDHCGECGNMCPDCQSCSSGSCNERSDFSACETSTGICLDGACCGGCWDFGFGEDRRSCELGTTAEFCGSDGERCGTCEEECRTCATGSCEPAADGALCTDGVCGGGDCCDTCFDGAGMCQPTSSMHCGSGGGLCATCECATDVCVDGACSIPDAVTFVASGELHTCALLGTRLFCWGDNVDGQLGTGPGATEFQTPRAVLFGMAVRSMGVGHRSTCAVVSNTLYCWGDNDSNQAGSGGSPRRAPNPFAGSWTGFDRPLGLGRAHACGTDGGDLVCWGNNEAGQLGTAVASPVFPPEVSINGESDAIPYGGAEHTCVRVDRDILCTGSDAAGQLGNGTGGDSSMFVAVPPTGDWETLAVGADFSCGTRIDSSLYCWGSNAAGQLGTGTAGGSEQSPVQVGTDFNWSRVYAGFSHTCAIRSTGDAPGELWCWGDNRFGQIGNGTTSTSVNSPVRVGTGLWKMASPGGNHTCAIDDADVLHCWGQNNQGQLGLASGATTVAVTTPQRVCFP